MMKIDKRVKDKMPSDIYDQVQDFMTISLLNSSQQAFARGNFFKRLPPKLQFKIVSSVMEKHRKSM